MNNLNSKTIIPSALAIIEIFLIFTSNWANETFAGEVIEKIKPPFEWGPALISSIVILIFIWRKKEHPLASFTLIGCFLFFLIRAKVFGFAGVENLKEYGEVSIQMTSRFWIMFAISILMLIVDIVIIRKSKSNQATQA